MSEGRARKEKTTRSSSPPRRRLDREVEMKKLSPDRREATPGILRLDFGKPRRSSGGSVDFRGVPDRLGAQAEPPSPQPSIDRLSVTFAERSDTSESSVKVNVFDPGSPPSQLQGMEKVRFTAERSAPEEDEEEDDYSASVSAILQRRESTRRSSKRKKRRPSSPFSGCDGDSALSDPRRRSSVFTNSSGETAISVEEGTTQEQIFENLRLHKEVLSSVRLQPWAMRRKIKLVQQAKAYVKRHEGELQERLAMSRSTRDMVARFNILFIKKLQYLRRELANTMTLLIPWELRIKEIESHFGSAVASYFTFLRWMFWVNLVITVVLACFVIVPEVLTADKIEGEMRKEMLPDEKGTSTNLVTMWDFEGILKYSPIFYGFYTKINSSSTGYRLPFAYFMTGLAVYVYSFVATLRRMAKNSRMSKLSEKDDECAFTWKLFSGWDYMIGNAETAHNRVASLVLGFKEALLEETEKKKDEKNWKVIALRVLVNILVLGLLFFSAYVVFVVVERSTQAEAESSWWRQNEITVSLSIISLIFPIFFELLGLMEGYHPRKCLRIQLARIMVLNLLNLYTLIFSQFWKISNMAIELRELRVENNIPEPTYDPISTTTLTTLTVETKLMPICYEMEVDCPTSPTDTPLVTSTVMAAAIANLTLLTLLPTLATNTTTDDSSTSPDVSTSTEYFSNSTEYFLRNITEWNSTDYEGTEMSTEIPESTSRRSVAGIGHSNPFFRLLKSSMVPIIENMTRSVRESMMARRKVKRTENTFEGSTTEYENVTESTSEGYSETLPDLILPTEFPPLETTTVKKCRVVKCDSPYVRPTKEPMATKLSVISMETKKRLRKLCWETMFGQELVKLTVMDLVLTVLSILLVDFFRAVFVRVMNRCWCWDLEKRFPQYGDFKIAENILHLVNNQGLVWMGMFFSPGLPAINLVKLAIMMYLRSWAVLTCNVPHEVVFRASRSNNFYLALLLTMLFLCVLPVGYAIVWIEPSWHCGPFSEYKRIYHLFTQSLQKALPKSLHKALDYIASPGIIIPLLVLLVLIIYYLISLTNSLREANTDLKVQLRRERTEERRKVFQMVDKKRKGSGDSETPFNKWKKLLDLSPKPSLPLDVEKGVDNGGVAKKELNRKELLSRLMKRALRKSSGTSDDDMPLSDDGEQADSLFDENISKKPKKPEKTEVKETVKPIEMLKKAIPKVAEAAAKEMKVVKPQKITKKPVQVQEGKRKKSPTSECSTQRNSVTSDWSENIPVIKISKTESDECILKDAEGRGRQKRGGRGLKKFKEAVEKQMAKQRKEKEKMSQKLNKKAGELQERKKEEIKQIAQPLPAERKTRVQPEEEIKQVEEKTQEETKAVETKSERMEEVRKTVSRDDTMSLGSGSHVLEGDKACPIATAETVSSDLDLSVVSLKMDDSKN